MPASRGNLAAMHREVRDAYCGGSGLQALDLMLDLERVLADERPLRKRFRRRYRDLFGRVWLYRRKR